MIINVECACTDDTAFAPAAADESCMASHPAAGGQNAFSGAHAFDVFGIGFFTDQDGLNVFLRKSNCFFGGENDLADRAAGSGRQPLGNQFGFLFRRRIQDRMQQFVELCRRESGHGHFFGDHLFFEHVHRHVQRGGAGTFTDAALEHVEYAFLNGELDIKHILVVIFKSIADCPEFFVSFRQNRFHGFQVLVLLVFGRVVQRTRSTGTGNDVFALSVDQPFAVELVFAGGGVAGERNAGGGTVAHVTENHALDVDSCAPFVRNAFDTAVGNSLLAVPAFEYRADAAPELLHGIIREFSLQYFLDSDLEIFAEFFQVGNRHVGVSFVVFLVLQDFHLLVEELADTFAGGFDTFSLFHHDVGIHHDQAAVSIINETFVFSFLDQAGDGFAGETDVKNGFHHAGHRAAGAGTAGDQQGFGGIAELQAHGLFDTCQSSHDFFFERSGILGAVFEIVHAAFSGDGETSRYRQIKFRHFSEVRTFTAEQFFH